LQRGHHGQGRHLVRDVVLAQQAQAGHFHDCGGRLLPCQGVIILVIVIVVQPRNHLLFLA